MEPLLHRRASESSGGDIDRDLRLGRYRTDYQRTAAYEVPDWWLLQGFGYENFCQGVCSTCCVRDWGRHHTMSSIDHDVRVAFVGIESCDGAGLASNDGIATQSASSVDRRLPANSKASSGHNAGRMTRFLADRRPALFCDDCIADKTGPSNRREANRITSTLGKSSIFWRDVGACSVCARHKQVIRHV